MADLTPRQRQILGLMSNGAANKQVAHQLGITEQAVKNQVTHILHKLGAANRTEAVALYLTGGGASGSVSGFAVSVPASGSHRDAA